jgi:hypothetical protein
MPLYTCTHNLPNVLIQIANKMSFKKRSVSLCVCHRRSQHLCRSRVQNAGYSSLKFSNFSLFLTTDSFLCRVHQDEVMIFANYGYGDAIHEGCISQHTGRGSLKRQIFSCEFFPWRLEMGEVYCIYRDTNK